MKICSMVVLYESKEKEIANILCYYDYVDKVYILDNSTKSNESVVDGILSKKYGQIEKKVEYIHFQKNIGLCKALNKGMKIAAEEGFKWALVMDADSTLKTNVVDVYKEFIKRNSCSNVGILAPVHLFDRNMKHQFEGERNVSWAMTSGCFFYIEVFMKLQGFKEELFVDGLDIDYCYKLGRNGYRVVELSNAQINHFPGETKSINFLGKKLKYGIASPWRYYMQARAIVWLMLEYRSVKEFIRYGMKWGKVICLFPNKREYIKQMIRGTKAGVNLWRDANSN